MTLLYTRTRTHSGPNVSFGMENSILLCGIRSRLSLALGEGPSGLHLTYPVVNKTHWSFTGSVQGDTLRRHRYSYMLRRPSMCLTSRRLRT